MSMSDAGCRMRSSGCRSSDRPACPPRCQGAAGPLLLGGLLLGPLSALLSLLLLPSSSIAVGAGCRLLRELLLLPSLRLSLPPDAAEALLLLRLLLMHSKPPARAARQAQHSAHCSARQLQEAPLASNGTLPTTLLP